MDELVQQVITSETGDVNPIFYIMVGVVLTIQIADKLIYWYRSLRKKPEDEEVVSGNSVQRFIKLLDAVEDIQRQTDKISDIDGRLHSYHNDINSSMKDFSKSLDKTFDTVDKTANGVDFLIREAKKKDQFI